MAHVILDEAYLRAAKLNGIPMGGEALILKCCNYQIKDTVAFTSLDNELYIQYGAWVIGPFKRVEEYFKEYKENMTLLKIAKLWYQDLLKSQRKD